MKKLLITLTLCALPIGLLAMERERTLDTFKNEIVAAMTEQSLQRYEELNAAVFRSDAKRFGPEIVAEAHRLIELGENAPLQEIKENAMLVEALVAAAKRVDGIAGLSRPELMMLESRVSGLRSHIEGRPKREAEAHAAEQARAKDLAQIAIVKQLLIQAYYDGGEYEAAQQLKAHFQEPLGAAPAGMSQADWQEFGIRKSPGWEIDRFAQKIKNEVLRNAEALIADPAAADIASINRTIALLVAVKMHSATYITAISYIAQLETIKKQKQAGN